MLLFVWHLQSIHCKILLILMQTQQPAEAHVDGCSWGVHFVVSFEVQSKLDHSAILFKMVDAQLAILSLYLFD